MPEHPDLLKVVFWVVMGCILLFSGYIMFLAVQNFKKSRSVNFFAANTTIKELSSRLIKRKKRTAGLETELANLTIDPKKHQIVARRERIESLLRTRKEKRDKLQEMKDLIKK